MNAHRPRVYLHPRRCGIMKTMQKRTRANPLPPASHWPAEVRALFWDTDISRLRPGAHRVFVVQRILEAGGIGALRWLKDSVRDEELARHLEATSGRGLTPRRLRFFELTLRLKRSQVTSWIRAQEDSPTPGRRVAG